MPDLIDDTRRLAARHGLRLVGDITFNEMGLDYRVAFATDEKSQRWVLRLPRRDGMGPAIEREARILDFVRPRLPVAVPDWQVREPDLIAYPMLPDPMALVYDATTYEVTWGIDPAAAGYARSLARVLVALHAAPAAEAVAAGIPHRSPREARSKVREDLELVKASLGLSRELEDRLRRWLDDDTLWPEFTVLTHGDLYAGHVTATPDGRITGVIDWSEATVDDPSVDFAGHLAAFDEESLRTLIKAYAEAGGRTWPRMLEHVVERYAAAPIKYGAFAIATGNERHVGAAKGLLGVA